MPEVEIREIDIAKIESCDIGFDDHGLFLMFARFVYRSGSQGIGYVINEEFIKKFIRACDVQTLFQCNGVKVKIEHSRECINKIIPLSKNREVYIFDIDKWRNDSKVKICLDKYQ